MEWDLPSLHKKVVLNFVLEFGALTCHSFICGGAVVGRAQRAVSVNRHANISLLSRHNICVSADSASEK